MSYGLYAITQYLVYSLESELRQLSESLVYVNDPNTKKNTLYTYFYNSREKFLRLLALVRWAQKHKQGYDRLQDILTEMFTKEDSMLQTTNSLFSLDAAGRNMREADFDLPTAIDVLTTGNYNRLPKSIESLLDVAHEQKSFTHNDIQTAISRLTDLIRLRILQSPLPPNVSVVSLKNGQITLMAKNEFQVTLTLGKKENDYFWKILWLRLLVNEAGVAVNPINGRDMHDLKNGLQQRLFCFDETELGTNHLQDIYSRIHDICMRIVMDIIGRSGRMLQTTKWKDIITFDFSYEQELTIVAKYWANAPFVPGVMKESVRTSDISLKSHELRISLDKKKNLVIEHYPSLEDVNAEELNYSAIDLSELIFRVMQHHATNRLRALYKLTQSTLTQNSVIIPLYAQYNLVITVDWRTGKFEFDSEVDVNDICKPINQETKVFETVFLDCIEKSKKRAMLYAYERAATMLGLSYFIENDHVDILFPKYNTVLISIFAGKKPKVWLIYEREPLVDHKVPSSLLENKVEEETDEPARKRQKTTHGEIYLSSLRHLKRVIEYGKGRVCQSLILKDLRNYVKVIHNTGESVENTLVLKPTPSLNLNSLQIDHFVLRVNHETGNWSITVVEESETKLDGQNDLVFEYNNNNNNIAESTEKLLNDLRAIDRMSYVIRQYKTLSHPNITTKQLTHMKLVFNYGPHTASIKYENNSYVLDLYPTHELESFMREAFNQSMQSKDPNSMKRLILILESISSPVLIMKEILCHRRNLLWTIIPRNMLHLKLIYTNSKYEYEVRFLQANQMSITAIIPDDNTNSMKPTPYNIVISTADKERFRQAINDFNRYASSVPLIELSYNTLLSNKMPVQKLSDNSFVFIVHETHYTVKIENNEATLMISHDTFTEAQKKFLQEQFRLGVILHGIESGISPDRTFMPMFQILFMPVTLLKQLIDAIIDMNTSRRKVFLLLFTPLRTNDTTSEILQGLNLPKNIISTMKGPVDTVIPFGSRLVIYGKIGSGRDINQFFCLIIRIRDKHLNQYVDVPLRILIQANQQTNISIVNKYSVSITLWSEVIKSGDMTVIAQQLIQKANEDDSLLEIDIDKVPDDNLLRKLLRLLCDMEIDDILALQ